MVVVVVVVVDCSRARLLLDSNCGKGSESNSVIKAREEEGERSKPYATCRSRFRNRNLKASLFDVSKRVCFLTDCTQDKKKITETKEPVLSIGDVTLVCPIRNMHRNDVGRQLAAFDPDSAAPVSRENCRQTAAPFRCASTVRHSFGGTETNEINSRHFDRRLIAI